MKKQNNRKGGLLSTALKLGVVAVFALCSAAVLSGCKKCEHDVSMWEEVVPATCTAKGTEKGICAICLEEVTREIEVNPDAHEYGDWEIEKPTDKAVGNAKKVCKHDASHTINKELPKLSSLEYTSSITKRPTAIVDGERTYVLEHIVGDIVFTMPVKAGGIASVMDAVEVASAEESHLLIRNAEGTIGYEFHRPAYDGYTAPDATSTSTLESIDQYFPHSYKYEFGENYTHIFNDTFDNNTERWYSTLDGVVYGFAESVANGFYDETSRVEGAANYIDGYRFVLQYELGLGAYFGTENLLAGLYKQARLSENEDFKESITKNGGETVYSFQFGHFDGDGDNGRFGNVVVNFTITDEYTIKTVDVKSTVYANNLSYDEATNGQYNPWEIKVVNGKKVARVKPGRQNGPRYIDYITVSQKTIKECEGEEVPQNPYKPGEVVLIDTFDVTYNGAVLNDSDVIECRASNASGGNTVQLGISNVQPSAAIAYGKDGFKFYYRDKDGNDHLVDYDTLSDVGVNVYNNSLRFQLAGEVTIVIKTARTEKLVKFNVARVAPSALYPTAFEYTRTGYFANKMATGESVATVYAGQPLYFRADPSALEVNYADGTVTSSVTGGNAANCTLVDEVASNDLPLSLRGTTQKISSFVTDVPGVYVVTMRSAMSSGVSCSITVTVKEAPDIYDILSGGTYMQELSYPVRGKVEVKFYESEGEILADVIYNKHTTVLKCIYDADTKQLSTEIKSGGGLFDETFYNFSMSLNEAYDIVLTHPTGMGEGLDESVILRRDTTGILSGTYSGDQTYPENVKVFVEFSTVNKVLRAEVDVDGVIVVLICEYSVTEDKLTTTIESGADTTDKQYSLSFDISYNLVLTHPTEEGAEESIVLTPVRE